MPPIEKLTNAQLASYRSLCAMSGVATVDGGYVIRVNEPEALHGGEYSSVIVKVEAWNHECDSTEEPKKSERRFLIEAGGCIAELKHGA